MKKFFSYSIIIFLFALSASYKLFGQSPIIIDYRHTDLSKIPVSWINQAKSNLHIAYGHTSHGSQLVTGLLSLRDGLGSPYDFSYTSSGYSEGVFLNDYGIPGASDLGNPDRTTWATATRNLFNRTGGCDRNVVVWSWCGQADTSSQDIQLYLDLMNQLEQDFPNVVFVYMTGHLNGTGVTGNLHQRNEQIRAYCITYNKVLFDFADIESYDPDGQYFLDKGANDGCNYAGGNWAIEWLAAHPASGLAQLATQCGSCAHSEKLNCVLKGRAFWWLLARLAGWPGSAPKSKVDFNQDGQEDILWRYYGPGGYNYVWYMGQSGGISGLQTMNSRLTNMFQRPAAAKVYWDAREAGGFLEKTAGKVYRDAWEAAGLRSWKKAPTISDGQFGMPGKAKGIRILKTPVENTVGLLGSMCIGTAFLPAVLDVNWQVAGTGDFNGDGKVDILWRYYGGGGAQGLNYVWYMDGVTCLGGVLLPAVLDTSWQIAGTGDFNGDGKVDILWRYYNPSQQMILCVNGENYVWYMNDVTCTGTEFLPPVPDTNWRIQNH